MRETVLNEIAGCLLAGGGNVKISGFGTFTVRHKVQCVGPGAKTGDKAIVSRGGISGSNRPQS
jgi:nucleoid DNA-binding protein